MPPDRRDEPGHVLFELPREARLADAGDARDEHDVRLAFCGRTLEEVLHEAKLAVTPDERRLEACGAPLAAAVRDDA